MDEPPPLEDCSEFLKNVHSRSHLSDREPQITPGASTTITRSEDKTSLVDIAEDTSCVASIISTSSSKISKATTKPKPLRRGFLSELNDKPSVPKKQEVPFITAKRTGSKVPDFLYVKMDDHPKEKLKKEVKGQLRSSIACSFLQIISHDFYSLGQHSVATFHWECIRMDCTLIYLDRLHLGKTTDRLDR